MPGTERPISTAAEVHEFVREHGCPVIVKAAFGGGGRGMRKIERKEEVGNACWLFKVVVLLVD